MKINDYEVEDPKGSPAGRQLEDLTHAHPFRTERLVQSLEDFVRNDTTNACHVAGSASAATEVFLVPPRFVLAHVPDAAALVRVSHERAEIEIVEIIIEYGGYNEQAQWERVKKLALEIIERDAAK